MSHDAIAKETRRKLDELGQKINEAKESLGAKDEIAAHAKDDWHKMVESHADIRRRLDSEGDQSAQVLEGIRFDIDILRHSFERWMARNETEFDKE